jgi:glutathione S-transferase
LRIAAILQGLAHQLTGQQTLGSPYLVGQRLSAADLYWACFSNSLAPLPPELNPIPDWVRALYTRENQELPALLSEHRDRIYRDHIGLPLDF